MENLISGTGLENLLKDFQRPYIRFHTKRFSKSFSKSFLTPHFGLFRKATISMDFDPFLPPFWPLFGPYFGSFSGSFWLHFGLFLELFLGPLRGRVLSENTRKTKCFYTFQPSKRARFRVHFRANFGQVLGSILGSFWCTFWEAGRTQFFTVLGLAWPAPGAGVRKFSPGNI